MYKIHQIKFINKIRNIAIVLKGTGAGTTAFYAVYKVELWSGGGYFISKKLS